jgi:hypothetical protein
MAQTVNGLKKKEVGDASEDTPTNDSKVKKLQGRPAFFVLLDSTSLFSCT